MIITKLVWSDEDRFQFSILYSLHYYDIPHNPERIYKLIAFENKYNFSHSTPNTINKAAIVKINNHRYAAIKLVEDDYANLKELLQSFSHTKLNNLRV